jgi:acyl-coenzyme A thioesterase PaaI-like protein
MSAPIEKHPARGAVNGHNHCLMCGSRNPFSLGLRFHSGEQGSVWARFKAQRRFQGYDGILHGGVISALLDAAMTHCLFHHGVQAVTGDLRVRFLKPVPCKDLLHVRAWLLSATPPLFRVAAILVYGQRVMARAEAKFMQAPVP